MLQEAVTTDVFKSFAERNKKMLAEMGVNPASLRFTTITGEGSEPFKHGRLLEQLAASKTFPASVTPGNNRQVDAMERDAGGVCVTREAMEKKLRTSIIVPVLIAVTMYLLLTLLL